MKIRPLIILAALLAAACAPQAEPFWLGADISGSAGAEKRGEYYYNHTGDEPVEVTALMKEIGLNAVRLRVWVDPKPWGRPGQIVDSTDFRGLCNKEDVLYNARLARDLGMEIMIGRAHV